MAQTPPPITLEAETQNPAETVLGLSDILNSMPIGVLIIDRNGRVLHGNNQAAALLGAPKKDLSGVNLNVFWPKSAEEIMAAMRSGRQASGFSLPELDGCFVQCNPLSGRSQGAAITIYDNRLWQTYLGASQALDPLTPYFKKVFESSSDGISIADRHGRLLLVNEASARHVGVKPEDLVGKHVSALVDLELTSGIVTPDVIAGKHPITRLINHYKTNKHILLTGTPIFDFAGEVHLVVLNERDLTALFELKTSLKQQQEILDRYKNELATLQMAELKANEVVAISQAMRLTLETATKLAHHSVAQILITGESGTGKGLLAKFVHSHSNRAKEPFIHINCAALPEHLLEAELFGYEKGAFTGAAPQGRAGLFEMAGAGTVFLDEIGEMPLSIQAKLLTFLDNREFRRISGHQVITASCAVIAATNQDLESLAAKKKFRSDLYYRLNVFKLVIPPLRERPEDLMELARRELEKQSSRYGQKRELDALALEVLRNYSFPGNARELLNCLQQASLLCDGPAIGEFLDKILRNKPKGGGPHPRPQMNENVPPSNREISLSRSVAHVERAELVAALKQCRNTREMATLLNISQPTVSRKLRKHGLKPPNK